MDWQKHSFDILNALTRPILVIDRNYRIVAANTAACSSFCLPLDNIVGRECFRVTHNVDKPCWQQKTNCPVKVAFELKEKTRVIHQHEHAGSAAFEEIIAIPIFDERRRVNFVVEELSDITELLKSKEMAKFLKREVSTLQGIIPICASCKNIRDDKGYWQKVEAYVRDRSEADFSHSLCPQCAKKLYPELDSKEE